MNNLIKMHGMTNLKIWYEDLAVIRSIQFSGRKK
jgi:hypothetical protein